MGLGQILIQGQCVDPFSGVVEGIGPGRLFLLGASQMCIRDSTYRLGSAWAAAAYLTNAVG